MAAHGVPVSPYVTAASTSDALAAVEARADITFPVVAKLCGNAIAHKTERGLVKLRLADVDQLRDACDELFAAATPADGDVTVLISTMVAGNRELIAGLLTDPQFGLTIMVGVGGILAEAVSDVSFRLVPLDRVDAAEMIDDLNTQKLLGPFRGEPALDREALIDALLGLAAAGLDDPNLVSADLNPLIIVDGQPIAVDALIELGEAK